jgi:hypothetical protein
MAASCAVAIRRIFPAASPTRFSFSAACFSQVRLPRPRAATEHVLIFAMIRFTPMSAATAPKDIAPNTTGSREGIRFTDFTWRKRCARPAAAL